MATSTGTGTHLGPRIALGVELEHTRPGPASVADIAIALDVLTAIITDYPGETEPLSVDDAGAGFIGALVVLEYDGAPLIVVGGGYGRVRSWRVDGAPGPLSVDDPDVGPIGALVVLEYDGAPLIVVGGDYGARSWRVDGTLRALSTPGAHEVHVRALSLGSLDVVLLLPSVVGSAGAAIWKLDRILDALERVAGFPAQLPDRLEAARQRAKKEHFDAEADALEAEERRDAARAARQRRRLHDAGYRPARVVVGTEDEEGL